MHLKAVSILYVSSALSARSLLQNALYACTITVKCNRNVCCVHSLNGTAKGSSVSRAYSFFHSFLPFTRPIPASTSGSIMSPKIDSGVGLVQFSDTWQTVRGLSILRICLSRFYLRSLARDRTLTVDVLASSAISLPVISDSILEHVVNL